MRRGRLLGGRRGWVVSVVVIVVAVIVGARALTVQQATGEAEVSRRSAEQASVQAIGDRQAAQRRVDDLALRITQVEAELAAVGQTTAERQSVMDQLDGALGQLREQLALLEQGLAFGTLLTETQAAQKETLRACLLTVVLAQALFSTGRQDDAVGVLREGAEGCRRAQATLDGQGDGADFAYDFPDPFVLVDGGSAYAFATNGTGGAIQVLNSTGFSGWQLVGSALAGVPTWAEPGLTWAPAVLKVGSGYLMYYSARERATGKQCISVAASAAPEGPYSDGTLWPLVCQRDQGGSIDPSAFRAADGSTYLVWKSEGEIVGGGAQIWSQRLADDGQTLLGAAAVLVGTDQEWEGRTIEGPSMAVVGDHLVLVYSANRWDSTEYAVGQALCDTPLGPCRKLDGPIMRTGGELLGPGGAELFRDAAGALRVAFHTWAPNAVGNGHPRRLHIGAFDVADDGRLLLRG